MNGFVHYTSRLDGGAAFLFVAAVTVIAVGAAVAMIRTKDRTDLLHLATVMFAMPLLAFVFTSPTVDRAASEQAVESFLVAEGFNVDDVNVITVDQVTVRFDGQPDVCLFDTATGTVLCK
jgi:hypothetical protein